MSSGEYYEPRISNFLAVVLVTVAITVDLAQIVLTLVGFVALGIAFNSMLSSFTAIFFGIVLTMNQVSFFTHRKIVSTALTLIMEIAPLANNIPVWTFYTVLTIRSSRKEDREAFNKQQSQEQARTKYVGKSNRQPEFKEAT